MKYLISNVDIDISQGNSSERKSTSKVSAGKFVGGEIHHQMENLGPQLEHVEQHSHDIKKTWED